MPLGRRSQDLRVGPQHRVRNLLIPAGRSQGRPDFRPAWTGGTGADRASAMMLRFTPAFAAFVACLVPAFALAQAVDRMPAIAHAGGGYAGETYTNSIEALDANAAAYELFEIDFV